VSLGLAAALAAVLLYYSLRGLDWTEVWSVVRRADPTRLAAVALMASTTLFLRGWRWRILLNAEGRVSVAAAFWATAAGLFGNNFLPARAGELVRTYMIAKKSRLGIPYVLATALSERIVDAILLVAMSALVLLALPSPPGWLAAGARPMGAIGLAGAITIGVLPLLGSALRGGIERLPLNATLRDRIAESTDRALEGMRTFHDARRLTLFVSTALVIWCLDAAGTVVGGAALGLRIPAAAAFLLIAGLSLGSALPSTPGYVGIYQFVAVSVLKPFGFSPADAIAYILVAQALSYLVIGCWGTIGLVRYRREGEKGS
jgi:uncharacterized membrane protein YbhN (UPF0104 family)